MLIVSWFEKAHYRDGSRSKLLQFSFIHFFSSNHFVWESVFCEMRSHDDFFRDVQLSRTSHRGPDFRGGLLSRFFFLFSCNSDQEEKNVFDQTLYYAHLGRTFVLFFFSPHILSFQNWEVFFHGLKLLLNSKMQIPFGLARK